MTTRPFVRIDREWDYHHHCLEWGDGTTTWSKNLTELTSFINVTKDKDSFKKSFCEIISTDIGRTFTVADLDKIITKQDYQLGAYALYEYTHIVESNTKAVEQGKEPKYLGTSISGSILMKNLPEKDTKND